MQKLFLLKQDYLHAAVVFQSIKATIDQHAKNVSIPFEIRNHRKEESAHQWRTCGESSFFGEYTIMSLTDKGKELFFEEDATIFIEEADAKNLIRSDSITAKELFFSEEEQKQLSMVCDSIKEENYLQLVSRLESKGLSKGIAVLLYGAPGTGKTESVKQWAKETGRDIVHVDLSA